MQSYNTVFERMKVHHSNLEYKMGARAKQEFYLSKQIVPPPRPLHKLCLDLEQANS